MISAALTLQLDKDGKLPAYAWPGGYPIYYFDDTDAELCVDCANSHAENSLVVVKSDCNWEDPYLYCENCYKPIEVAYLSDEEAAAARQAPRVEYDTAGFKYRRYLAQQAMQIK